MPLQATQLTFLWTLTPNQPTTNIHRNSVFDDRLLFYRERGAGVYGALPYWFSSSLAYIPQSALASVTYCSVVYYMSGLNVAPGKGKSRRSFDVVSSLSCHPPHTPANR